MRTVWLITAALVLLLPSVQAESPVDGLNDDPSFRLRFALDPFKEPIGYSIRNGNAKEMILRRFGEPTEVLVSVVSTRFPGETYTSYSFRFKDIAFVVGKWPDRKHSWIKSIEIVGNSHRLKSGVGIGSSRGQITEFFSPPARFSKPNSVTVEAHIFEKKRAVPEDGSTIDEPGATYKIVFEFDKEDRVSKIAVSAIEST